MMIFKHCNKDYPIKLRVLCGKFLVCLCTGLCFFASCSSVPKRPLEVFVNRNMAANQLDLANRTANQGRYSDALMILEDARRFAESTDDPPLLIKTSLTRGNILFSMGQHGEAFENWNAALAEGENAGLGNLTSLARISICRGNLVLLMGSGNKTAVEDIRNQVNRHTASIKSDPAAQASGYLVLGMAEKELQRFREAERALRKALDLHEKNRYLEEAAYDWFFIASVYSVEGRYNDALTALKTSISLDRRAENGFGLASSWQAMGEVYLKAGSRGDAADAFRRAAAIFWSIDLDTEAAAAEAKAR